MAIVSLAVSLAFIAAGERPNLVLLVADDLGHTDVGWANNRTVRTCTEQCCLRCLGAMGQAWAALFACKF